MELEIKLMREFSQAKSQYETPVSRIGAYLQKLREKQERSLADKSVKWGFNFKQTAPAHPDKPALSQVNGPNDQNFEWTAIENSQSFFRPEKD